MNVPEQVTRLIETFDRNIEAYKHHDYNETQLRHEFVDPFFIALGWDVNNTEGLAEAYKDVIHEDSIRIGSATKAPDYCFRIGGTRKFFVEAKKPSISIKDAPHPAFQLRRYAWSAKLPLSILTDFEEFAVYDCRVRPVKADRSSAARIKYIKYTEYPDRWEEIASVFSKDAILKGSFDKYAKSARRKKGTAEVDTAFLNEIETWRDIIARNIALRNPSLTNRQLNFAVQRTIDRIIFLRIAEDRSVEQYGQLLRQTTGQDTYKRLCTLFERADERYNSGLFHFSPEPNRPEPPDELTPNLTIDDKPLKDIVKSLYYPDSPYEFAVLPAEILGQIYEQFLGKVITLTKGHHAKIEYKPEVKKAGGVYYTPSYIVDYIVKNTVGKLLENKTPIAAAKLKILDPACGSGSFLIAAYQYLLDWHLKYYTGNNPSKYTKGRNPKLYQTDKGEYHLTIAERKRIVLNNIFGVDIDSQAVEVTKLSLLLKILEGETKLVLFHKERALPDLGNNIKCGNSLIGPDFYEGKQLTMFDEEERYRINVFDWKKEFSQILNRKNPGFDAVIGNPPYLKEKNNKELFALLRKSKTNKYCFGKMDLWYAFACTALDLLRPAGLHAFIATNNWITNYGASILRKKFMAESTLLQFVDFADYKVFSTASIQTMIYITKKIHNKSSYKLEYLKIPKTIPSDTSITNLLFSPIKSSSPWGLACVNPTRGEKPFTLSKLNISLVLGKIENKSSRYLSSNEIGNGIDVLQDFVSKKHLPKLKNKSVKVGDGVLVLSKNEKDIVALTNSDRNKIKPYFTTAEINRYLAIDSNKYWLIYADKTVRENIDNYPGIKQHLDIYSPILTSVYKPYGLHRPRNEQFFTQPKILSIRKTRKPIFCFVDFPCYVSRAFLIIQPINWPESFTYILGLLNSALVYFWLYHKGKKQGDQLQIDKEPLENIPIRTIDFSNPTDKSHHNRMVSLVQTMLDLNKQLAKAKTSHEKTALKRQIDATDRQIDNLVYELYNLTEEEIAIVEEMKSK